MTIAPPRKTTYMGAFWRGLKKVIANDSMSVALFSLFLICLIGQGLSGWFAYDDSLHAGHFGKITLGAYLRTGNFLDGIFSNWEAAILQLAVLIAFGSVLRQKGARIRARQTPGSIGHWIGSSGYGRQCVGGFTPTLCHWCFSACF